MSCKTVWVLCAVLFASSACGGGDEEVESQETFKAEESSTMATKGTAADAAEKARREAERKERLRKQKAAKELIKWGGRLDDAVEADEPFDMTEALEGIAQLGEDAKPFLPQLTPFLDHEDEDVRVAALKCLVSLKGPDVKARLRKAMESDNPVLRKAGLALWRKAGLKDKTVIMGLLDDLDGNVQYEAVRALEAAGADAADLKMLTEKVPDLDGPAARAALHLALNGMEAWGGPKAIEPLLVELLDHQDPDTRKETLDVISDKTILRRAVAAKVVRILKDDPEELVRRKAYEICKRWAEGKGPAYDPAAEEEERKEPAAAWKAWFDEHASKFESS